MSAVSAESGQGVGQFQNREALQRLVAGHYILSPDTVVEPLTRQWRSGNCTKDMQVDHEEYYVSLSHKVGDVTFRYDHHIATAPDELKLRDNFTAQTGISLADAQIWVVDAQA